MLDAVRQGPSFLGGVGSLLFASAFGGLAELIGASAARPDLLYSLDRAVWVLAAGCLTWAVVGLAFLLVSELGLGRLASGRRRPSFVHLVRLAPVLLAAASVSSTRSVQALGNTLGTAGAAVFLGIIALTCLCLWLLAGLNVARLGTVKLAAIALAVLTLMGAWAFISAGPHKKRPSLSALRGTSIVLITLDSARADHFGAYGAEPSATPNIDIIAESAVTFLLAYCTQPESAPSHATILTGLDPLGHGAWRGDGSALRQAVTTLPEMLGAAGYASAAFVSSRPLQRGLGFDQGFDVYDDALAGPLRTFITPFALIEEIASRHGGGRSERDSASTVDAALEWIGTAGRPFLVWVHLHDADRPYLDRSSGIAEDETILINRRWAEGSEEPGDEAVIRMLYRNEIEHADGQVGRIVDRLKQLGLYDEVILAVVGAHGEGLGDHGYKWHAERLYEEQVRVPIIVRLPKGRLGGTRLQILARTTDVAPTIYGQALSQAFIPAMIDGVDMSEAFESEVEEQEEMVLMLTGDGMAAGTDGQTKIIIGGGDGKPLIFDLLADPGELLPLKRVPQSSFPLRQVVEQYRRDAAGAMAPTK